jgi:Cysteine-rich CPCC
MSKFTGPCCGHKTLDSYHDWDICPVCFWEDDVLGDNDRQSPANHGMNLSQGQANFIMFGVSDIGLKMSTRPPLLDEPLDENWKPFTKAIELVMAARMPM